MIDPFAAIPVIRKRAPIKCSTCADKSRRVRGTVIDWKHCGRWTINMRQLCADPVGDVDNGKAKEAAKRGAEEGADGA